MRIAHQCRLINLIRAWSRAAWKPTALACVCDISPLTRNARTRLSRICLLTGNFTSDYHVSEGKAWEIPRLFYLYFHVPSRWNPDQEVYAKRPGSQRPERIAIKNRHKLWAGSRCCKMTECFLRRWMSSTGLSVLQLVFRSQVSFNLAIRSAICHSN